MSRTSNQTLPYWQFEVGLFDDGKTIELSDKYGPLGEAILFRIMCYITQSDGYFAQLNNALILYVYRSIGNKWIKDKRIISEVIQYCGVCGLFDVNLLRQNVITSQGIQRRWLSAKKKSRAQGFSTAKYWLLNENEPLQGEVYNNADNCNNNADNCNNNADNCNNNADIKVIEGNVNNIIHSNTREEGFDLLDYNELLQIVKEECPIVFNRHQAKVDSGKLQIVREVTQILEQLQGQYSYKQLREIFRKASKTFCVKPSYSSCDIKWVLNNIQRVMTEEESDTESGEQHAVRKSFKQLEHERGTDILRQLYEEEVSNGDGTP